MVVVAGWSRWIGRNVCSAFGHADDADALLTIISSDRATSTKRGTVCKCTRASLWEALSNVPISFA